MDFELRLLFKTARNAVIEIVNGEIFETESLYSLYLDGELVGQDRRVIKSLYGLEPDRDYEVVVELDGVRRSLNLRTEYEFVTLNVRDFGAIGDGVHDDTIFIQAAIMACPMGGRVLVPKGTFRISSLFLKSDLMLELAEGCTLLAFVEREKFPVFQGLVESYDEKEEYNLGTWEGNPLPMFTGILTGVNVSNVVIYGQGTIDGNADYDNWWKDPKVMRGAFRPRMLFFNRCDHITVQGIKVQNSPSWNIHPYFSRHLTFLDLSVINPKDSPNTDGLDPESCKYVDIVGVYFSVGDDCIAIKAGKIYMGAKYKVSTEHMTVRQCCMRDGHGSVTIGSEMAGGVRDLLVQDCLFLHTDRGLRIKTRRGRGKDAVVDGVVFDRIRMDHVMTPFVVNHFYFCDPDGHSEYVRTKDSLLVDERTPLMGSLVFRNIEAGNCHVAAAFFYGLPEQKIRRVEMEHIRISYAVDAKMDVPAMMDGIEPCMKRGIYVNNIEVLKLKDVNISGQLGDWLVSEHIDLLMVDGMKVPEAAGENV